MDHTDKREEDVRNITNSEEENDNFVIDLLRQQVNDKVTVDIEQPKEESTENIIKNANNKFLLDVLSPEIKKNEEKKDPALRFRKDCGTCSLYHESLF